MTGPEHYRKAEELVVRADRQVAGTYDQATIAAMAQVHATLALAAANASGLHTWREVLKP